MSFRFIAPSIMLGVFCTLPAVGSPENPLQGVCMTKEQAVGYAKLLPTDNKLLLDKCPTDPQKHIVKILKSGEPGSKQDGCSQKCLVCPLGSPVCRCVC